MKKKKEHKNNYWADLPTGRERQMTTPSRKSVRNSLDSVLIWPYFDICPAHRTVVKWLSLSIAISAHSHVWLEFSVHSLLGIDLIFYEYLGFAFAEK